MLKRNLTATAYVAFIAVFYLLKFFTNYDIWFDIPIYLFMLIGTYEILDAFKKKADFEKNAGKETKTVLSLSQKVVVWLFAIAYLPVFFIFETLYSKGAIAMSACVFVAFFALLCLLVADYKTVTIEGTGAALLSCFYPTVLLSALVLLNHMDGVSDFAVLLVFSTAPIADSFALIFGKAFGKKLPKKMATEISPKKTVIGGIGGAIGGAVIAIVCYLVFRFASSSFVFLNLPVGAEVAIIGLIGLGSAFVTEIGDLAESAVKRKAGIKDSGKILPGHGGILDRIDGTMFSAVFIYIVFVIINAFIA